MATDPRDLLMPNILGQGAHSALISRAVTDLMQEAYVTLPDFDPNLEWGPCKWQARDAVTLPAKGDPCLVIFDNNNRPWVVAWWPF